MYFYLKAKQTIFKSYITQKIYRIAFIILIVISSFESRHPTVRRPASWISSVIDRLCD